MTRQTLLKTKLVKINGTWTKLYKDAATPVGRAPVRFTSWKSINLLIDAALDAAAYDHVILHKPFTPVLL